jgi:Tfp pilus assembly protein PilV
MAAGSQKFNNMKTRTTYKYKNSNKGISIVEVVVATTIMLVAVVSIVSLFGGLTSLAVKNAPKVQAAMLLEEGVEALRIMRDAVWTANINNLSNSTTYRLVWQNSRWQATTTAIKIDSFFDRTFTFAAVNRDPTSYDIVTSGGTLDTGTRLVTLNVAWFDGTATSTRTLQFNLYNSFNN